MAADRLRVALLGCGRIARIMHLRILGQLQGVEVVALAEMDERSLEEALALVPGATGAHDYTEVLARGDVEAVVICLPTSFHADAATKAFESGKHVYVEKPLASTCEEGHRVVEAWQRSGRVGMIGFNFRFHPLYLKAKSSIDAGQIGRPVAIQSVFSKAPGRLQPWKQLRASGGGALLNLASHHIDLARFLLDREVEDAWAAIRSVRTEGDTAALTLKLAGGIPVQTFVSTAATDDDRLVIHGDRGALLLDRYRTRRPRYVPAVRADTHRARLMDGLRDLVGTPARIFDAIKPPPEPSFASALQAFSDASRGGPVLGADILDGYRSLQAVTVAEKATVDGSALSRSPGPKFSSGEPLIA